MTRLVSLLLGFTALWPWWQAPSAPPPPPPLPAIPVALVPLAMSRVVFLGDDADDEPVARAALERVFRTPIGEKACELLASGVLAGPLTIELNHRGQNFTRYRVPGRELGETIAFDPWSRPLVDTDHGRIAALPETVLAHELGHAVFKLTDEETVIQAVENPARAQMGMPLRSHF